MKWTIGLMSLLMSVGIQAAVWKDSPYVVIDTLYPHDGGLSVFTSHADPNVSSCDGGKRFGVNVTDANYQVKASLLIAAFSTQKKVKLRYDASQPKTCSAVIDRFLIQK